MSFLTDVNQGFVLYPQNFTDSINTNLTLDKIKSDLHLGQLNFVNDTETEILGLCAGYGSGKTRSLLAKCFSLSVLNQGFTGIVLEPTQPLVRDLFVTEFEEFLLNYEIPYTFRSSPLPDFVCTYLREIHA